MYLLPNQFPFVTLDGSETNDHRDVGDVRRVFNVLHSTDDHDTTPGHTCSLSAPQSFCIRICAQVLLGLSATALQLPRTAVSFCFARGFE